MAQVHQAAQGFTDDEWDDILSRVAPDKDFVQQLQVGEKVSDEDLPRKLVELEVKEIFEATMRKVQSFVPMDSELEVQRLKRAGQDVVEEPAKIQRTGKAFGDDLDKLWNLVKERFRTTEPTKDKARELWVELKRLFKPDDNDTLWKLQRYMRNPLKWWLYDTCGVHHVSTKRGHDIYMLVEKDYPLTKALATLMLCNKLRVDQYSDMADELLQKINIIANRPRQ
ncbi:hypothetical protein Tco_0439880 [Tanacetum coccineum]